MMPSCLFWNTAFSSVELILKNAALYTQLFILLLFNATPTDRFLSTLVCLSEMHAQEEWGAPTWSAGSSCCSCTCLGFIIEPFSLRVCVSFTFEM